MGLLPSLTPLGVLSKLTFTTLALFLLSENARARAPPGPWDSFNYAPQSKTVFPTAIHSTTGDVRASHTGTNHKHSNNFGPSNRHLSTSSPTISLSSSRSTGPSWVTVDFGVEVGGLISFNFDKLNITGGGGTLSLSFTESPQFIRPYASDDSSYPSENTTYDGVLSINLQSLNHSTSPTHWTQQASSLRGGFRYLTFALNSTTTGSGVSQSQVTISNITCTISFMPHVDDLRAYSGWFYAPNSEVGSDGDLLHKVWYAGAYTVQTNTVPLNTGRRVPFAPAGSWANDATLGVAGPIIVDGAKRDRAVWPGDMGIAVPAQFVSTNDLVPTRNALSTMFAAINPKTGALPESGPPLSQQGSDTYHAWTLIGTYNYYLYSGDTAWLQNVWSNYTKAVAFLEAKVDPKSGLMNVTGLRDWARLGGGGLNAEGNALLYRVLITSSALASYLNSSTLSTSWSNNATALKRAFNSAFWVESDGMYRDNQTTTLYPQDANSFAVVFNLTDDNTGAKANRVSEGLEKNWNDLGPVAPELPDTISPFISGFELQAHFESGNDARALELIRRTWGYMLTTDLSVQSTLLEGFTANGSLAYRWYRGYNNDPAYTSHSHGWSSGPTPALTFYILGLTLTSPQGKTWSLAPHIGAGQLPSAQGGFETPRGGFSVKWVNNGASIQVNVTTPGRTTGVFVPPSGYGFGKGSSVDGVTGGYAASVKSVKLVGGQHSLVLVKL